MRYYFFLKRFKTLQISGGLSRSCLENHPPKANPFLFFKYVFTFTSASKDKSNNGDTNRMTVSYQPGNEAINPDLL